MHETYTYNDKSVTESTRGGSLYSCICSVCRDGRREFRVQSSKMSKGAGEEVITSVVVVCSMGVQDVVAVRGMGGPRCGTWYRGPRCCSGTRYRGSKMWYAVWGSKML